MHSYSVSFLIYTLLYSAEISCCNINAIKIYISKASLIYFLYCVLSAHGRSINEGTPISILCLLSVCHNPNFPVSWLWSVRLGGGKSQGSEPSKQPQVWWGRFSFLVTLVSQFSVSGTCLWKNFGEQIIRIVLLWEISCSIVLIARTALDTGLFCLLTGSQSLTWQPLAHHTMSQNILSGVTWKDSDCSSKIKVSYILILDPLVIRLRFLLV